MSWVPGGKTVSVNGCHYGKAAKFQGGRKKLGGITAGGLTAEATKISTNIKQICVKRIICIGSWISKEFD